MREINCLLEADCMEVMVKIVAVLRSSEIIVFKTIDDQPVVEVNAAKLDNFWDWLFDYTILPAGFEGANKDVHQARELVAFCLCSFLEGEMNLAKISQDLKINYRTLLNCINFMINNLASRRGINKAMLPAFTVEEDFLSLKPQVIYQQF